MNINRPIVLRALLLALVLPLLLALPGRATAQDAAGAFVPAPCMFTLDLGVTKPSGEKLGFTCGYVVVPVRHAAPDGPTLRLPVAVRRATGSPSDPLILAQGGPGGDAFEVFSILVPSSSVAASRDIIIFNQRGTPYAEPELTCPETDAVLADILAADTDAGEQLYEDALAACHARLLAEGIDLSAFNSLENAADVPMIAHALGYEEYNFYGVSYGTLLGLHLMRTHPEGLRSVILDSVVSTDINFIAESAASEDRVFGQVFAACAANPTCAAEYPNLEERFYAVLAQFDAHPVTLTLTDPDTGRDYPTYLDGRGLRSVLWQLLYVARMAAVIPKLVTDLEAGDLRYLQAMWPLLVFDQLVAEGMYYSVVCAEDADVDPAAVPLNNLRPEIAATARDELQSFVETCALWHVEQLPPSVDAPVVTDIPTLLLSGRFDPVTPPIFAQAAAAGLSHATVIFHPTAAHGVAFQDACVNDIMVRFLDNPDLVPDSSCLQTVSTLNFVPPNAPTFPPLAGVNSLKPRTLIVFGLAAVLVLLLASAFVVWPLVYIVRAFGEKRAERAPAARRLRWLSRGLMLAFAAVAVVLGLGLLVAIVASLADLTLATGLALPPAAAPLLWLPLALLLLAVGIVVVAALLWRQRDSGSTAGKAYYTVLALCAVALVILLASQGLLLPPL
ncbi:MAG TPA: alpha/beta fold hydrolase [Promineifilum sp.]|mgnify:CR=1 FL=1|nr:alpha/beta fold hydrolase [Promineifilum sp.]